MQLTKFRHDIQGLRAVAVLLVLIFHIWPNALPGGYVGVDVFFVISGFLITGLLVKELEGSSRRISLAAFYARRIRRLLPIATLVLAIVGAATMLWMPILQWKDTAIELLASTFYVENWVLVDRSVDYLAQDMAPSAVQHYWSLSVEEQFYILWPLLMMIAGLFARRLGHSLRTWLVAALALVSFASLGFGIYMSLNDPAPGYFLTTTRIWELGLGGLLALLAPTSKLSERVRALLAWGGLAAILAGGFLYSKATVFPGLAALLPTLGAAALLGANDQGQGLVGKLFATRPMQFLGGISYSLYLWHWPIIIFFPLLTDRSVAYPANGLIVVAMSIALSAITKIYVEDRFRHFSMGQKSRRRAIAAPMLAAACMGVVAVTAALPYQRAVSMQEAMQTPPARLDYPGAGSVLSGMKVADVAVIPSAAFARADRGSAYTADADGKRCAGDVKGDEVVYCDYGPGRANYRVVVLGDSHAVHWFPAFERVAETAGWKVLGASKSGCAFSTKTVQFGAPPRDYLECSSWTKKVTKWLIEQKPDLVIISESPRHAVDNLPPDQSQLIVAQGFIEAWSVLFDAGLQVAAIRDTPWQVDDVPGCMIKSSATVAQCSSSRGEALKDGGINIAASSDPRVKVLDFSDVFCNKVSCPAVIGNVMVYRDHHHLTATFARTLAPALRDRVKKIDPRAP